MAAAGWSPDRTKQEAPCGPKRGLPGRARPRQASGRSSCPRPLSEGAKDRAVSHVPITTLPACNSY